MTEGCGCCEINDYAPPDDDPYGPCETCGDAPEEHDQITPHVPAPPVSSVLPVGQVNP